MALTLPASVRVVEVGPRDGLQDESRIVPTEAKIAFIEALADAGHRAIEVTSFVSPAKVPQLSDADELVRRLMAGPARKAGVVYSALVPNEKGMERALKAGIRSVAVFVAASDAFDRANIGCTAAEALERFRPVAKLAAKEAVPLRAYVSTAFHCPYEGPIEPKAVVELSAKLRDLGAGTLALSDTTGRADPRGVDRLLDEVEGRLGLAEVALHLHDTSRRALANALVGLQRGIRELDASAGGLGGCPFSPGASGNLSTEDLLSMLHAMGIETGIDEARHARAVDIIRAAIGGRRRGTLTAEDAE